MQYIILTLYWLLIVMAVLMVVKGIWVMLSKKAVKPTNIFETISVSNIRQYNLLTGLLNIAIGGLIFVLSFLFNAEKPIPLVAFLYVAFAIVLAAEKKIAKKYVVED